MQKLKMQSADITAQNIEKIAALFPNCVTEREHNGKLEQAIDFDLLKQELSRSIVEGKQERYQLNWVGKADATVLANTPINKTLRPCREESVNFDSTENLFIEGDNLDALKLLQETYLGKVKMIYIDPPYNTGEDFIYNDKFSMENKEYQRKSGQMDDEGNHLLTEKENKGGFHSDWLSMIYSRLKLARNLLTDDGVIFISIDDNEQANLKRICDEVFGERNFIAELPTIMNLKGNNDQFAFSGTHEYTIVYSKQKNISKFYEFKISEDEIEEWKEDDKGLFKSGSGLLATSEGKFREDRPYMYFPVLLKQEKLSLITKTEYIKIYNKETGLFNDDFVEELVEKYESMGYEVILPIDKNNQKLRWTWGFDGKFSSDIDEIIINRTRNGISLNKKQRPMLGDLPSKKPKTIFYKPEYSSGNGTEQLKAFFPVKVFNNPKPLELIKDMCIIGLKKEDIIIDFFAGSATTAHAIMQLNAEDGGKRKFVLVQMQEELNPKNKKQKAAYDFCKSLNLPTNIAEISKERIRRAGQKIVQELADNQKSTEHLDIGFRVLKIDSSNMADIYYTPQQLGQRDIFNQVEHIKADRSEEDLLFQVLLDWGVDLTLPIEKRVINGKNVFFVDQSVLVACFDKEIDEELIKAITQYQPLRAVFRDDGFINDTTKINAEQLFKQLAPHSELRVI